MLTITFALDQENDGIEVRHDGKQVFWDNAPDGWTSYFQQMPRGVPVLLEYDNGDPDEQDRPPVSEGERPMDEATDLVRKGALARDRMERDPDVAAACDDLARLADLGALAGVAEVIRERRRQIEAKGHTPESDDRHQDMVLAAMALHEVHTVLHDVVEYSASPAECEDGLRKSGALAAAEIDRLNRAFGTQEIPADPAMTSKLPLIGRDCVVIAKLAKRIWHDLPFGTMVTPLRDTADLRGFVFEVQILDDKKKPTGHIARVQVTLDRFEQSERQAHGTTPE